MTVWMIVAYTPEASSYAAALPAARAEVGVLSGSSSEQRERRLVEAARRDRAAFRELYLEHVDAVFGYVVRRVRDRPTAEDLTAETFERAMRAIDRFEWRGVSSRAWLIRIADRRVTDFFRAQARRPTAQLPEEDHLLPTSPSAEVEAGRRQQFAEVRSAIEKLSAPQRLVLIMRLGLGVSHRDIGVQLGRREGAVRMLYQRSLQRLREELKEHD